MPAPSSRSLDETMALERDLLSLSDFDAIQNIVDLLKDMLDAINPKDPEATKNEVIVDLINQCQSHQKKLMQLVNSTTDEELLSKALPLNDSIQSLLAKKDAIARGLPVNSSSPFSVNAPTSSQNPLPPIHATSEEEEEDDFTQLARRPTKGRPRTAESVGSTTLQDASATETTSSSIFTGPLALPAPPQPVRTSMPKKQDMIDLLSNNLSTTYLSPHTPQTPFTPPPNASVNHPNATSTTITQSQFSPDGHGYRVPTPSMGQSHYSPNGYDYPTSSPTVSQIQFPVDHWNNYPTSSSQIYPAQQLQVPVNNYATPWTTQMSSSYPPPPWCAHPLPSSTPSSVPQPYSAPSFRSVPPSGAPMLQHRGSFSTRVPTAQSLRQTQINDEVNHSAAPSTQKPYVLSHRLFEDLVSLRTDSGSVSSAAALGLSKPGMSGQSTSGGSK